MDLLEKMLKIGDHARMRDDMWYEIKTLDQIIKDTTEEVEAYIRHDAVSVFNFMGVVQSTIPDTIFDLWCYRLYTGGPYETVVDEQSVEWAVGEIGGYSIKTRLTPYSPTAKKG